jgi:hypothetical protein
LAICTLLDPRFKNFDFVGATEELKEFAVESLTTAWEASIFKPKPVAQVAQQLPVQSAAVTMPTTAHGKASASSILRRPVQQSAPVSAAAAPAPRNASADELATYLAMQGVDDPDACMLEWWCGQDCKQGLPNLAQLARQHLGTPASSAGVERLFSRAGRMHDNLAAAMSDGTLQHSLFAAHNND